MKLASLLLLLLVIFTDISSAQNVFEEGMSYAKSPARQNSHTKALEIFKEDQQKSLKSKQGEYTENPPQTAYYSHDHGNIHKLKQDSLIETAKDENALDASGNPVPTPGKVITTAFVSRPVFKITGKEDFMQKGKIATDNANNIITDESNKHIDCQNHRMSACKMVNVEKNCNEVKLLYKVCEKIPKVIVYDEVYYQDQNYSGSITPTHNNGGTFTLPVSGAIISFSTALKSGNVWSCNNNYTASVQGSQISTYHPNCGKKLGDLNFSNSGLNAAVNATDPISFSFSGFSAGHWHSASYSLTIRARFTRKVAKLESWSELPCHYE